MPWYVKGLDDLVVLPNGGAGFMLIRAYNIGDTAVRMAYIGDAAVRLPSLRRETRLRTGMRR